MYSIDHLIKIAIDEDIGTGDITTNSLIDINLKGQGVIFAKESLIICGMETASRVFKYIDPKISIKKLCMDGDLIAPNDTIIELEGKVHSLLLAERIALNFLQRLSGIATHVKSFVAEIEDKKVRLVDTRKTAPGWRVLEKAAVRTGGAFNHRIGLFDGILIKDNHIAACGGITKAVNRVRQSASHLMKIEVEVTNMSEVEEALDAGVDVIMLDNMDIRGIKEAVKIIAGRAQVEVSGGITKENLLQLAETGVDIISSGALTHSAGCMDISMRICSIDQAGSIL